MAHSIFSSDSVCLNRSAQARLPVKDKNGKQKSHGKCTAPQKLDGCPIFGVQSKNLAF